MKKVLDKEMYILGIGLAVLLAEAFGVMLNLEKLNILTYLLAVGIAPAVVLFLTCLMYGWKSQSSKGKKYGAAIVLSVIASIALMVLCDHFITTEIVKKIVENSMTSSTTQASMNEASAGDNVQSFLLYTAFAGMGVFVGNKLRSEQVTEVKEYDE